MKPEHIKLLRLALHMNTSQAARYLAARPDHPDGVAETTWVRWENGKKALPNDMAAHLEAVHQRLYAVLSSLQGFAGSLDVAADDASPAIAYTGEPPADADRIDWHIQLAAAVAAHALYIRTERKDG